MAARSELSHRLRELKLAVMGRLVPRVLSRRTSGLVGLAKKLASKAAPAPSDEPTDPDLLHPEDFPEIVTRRSPQPVDGAEAGDQLGAPRRACTQG